MYKRNVQGKSFHYVRGFYSKYSILLTKPPCIQYIIIIIIITAFTGHTVSGIAQFNGAGN